MQTYLYTYLHKYIYLHAYLSLPVSVHTYLHTCLHFPTYMHEFLFGKANIGHPVGSLEPHTRQRVCSLTQLAEEAGETWMWKGWSLLVPERVQAWSVLHAPDSDLTLSTAYAPPITPNHKSNPWTSFGVAPPSSTPNKTNSSRCLPPMLSQWPMYRWAKQISGPHEKRAEFL